MAQERKPWHKQRGETMRAFQAFQLYIEHGTLLKVDEALYGERRLSRGQAPSRKQSNGNVQDWSVKFNWVARREAYIEHLADKKEQAAEKQIERAGVDWARRIEEIDSRSLRLIDQAQARLEEMLAYPTRRQHTTREETAPDGTTRILHITIEPARWTMASASALLDTISRTATSMAERRAIQSGDGPSAKLLDEDEMDAILTQLNEDEKRVAGTKSART